MSLVGALDNIRVVDFGHFVAGPVAGMLLADHGADVIKIDPPGGPRFKTEANATWNRGKRSIALDLKNPDDVATARSLIDHADVVIENFRPGVMDRLGLGDGDVRPDNQRLIYASMPGFGAEDARAGLPAWEGIVLAAADGFRPAVPYREMVQQLHRKPSNRDGNPTFTAEPMASLFAALISSVAITSALSLRDRTGEGQRLEVPLFDAVLQSTGIFAMAQLPFKPTFRAAMSPWNHQYRCADGRSIQLVCDEPGHADDLALLLERPDFIERQLTERRLASAAVELELIVALEQIFVKKQAEEWERILSDEGLPVAICQSSAQWLTHPQSSDGGFFVEIDDRVLGPTRQPAPVVQLSAGTAQTPSPAPQPDEHRTEILSELAERDTPERRITTPNSPVQGPLSGIRVLDLGTSLAGPACGRTLAEFGAQVIKIDDPNHGQVLYHHDVNRGKRSLVLDLEHDAGQALFWDLLGTADVVIESFLPGEALELELDYETISAQRPDIIYASLTAYGDEGPWSDLEGHAETVQALTGMQVRLGGEENPSVWPYGMATDYAAGYAAAFGIVMAIIERDRTGHGQRVSTSTTAAAGLLQSMFLIDHNAKVWDEPSGPAAVGFGPYQRIYQCEDGWVYFGASDPKQLEPVFGEVDLANQSPDSESPDSESPELDARLAEWFEHRTCSDAVEELVKHGMGAQELTWLNETMMDPVVVRRGLSVIRDHGAIGLLRTTGPGPWFSRSMVTAGRQAAMPGADAESVLAEVNRAAEISQLAAAGVIGLPTL